MGEKANSNLIQCQCSLQSNHHFDPFNDYVHLILNTYLQVGISTTHTEYQEVVFFLRVTSIDGRHLSSTQDIRRAISSTPFSKLLSQEQRQGWSREILFKFGNARCLKSSRQYIRHHPTEHAAFFTLLAKLFNNMVGGNGHIEYLCNNEGNQFVPKPVSFRLLQLLLIETSGHARFLHCRETIRLDTK